MTSITHSSDGLNFGNSLANFADFELEIREIEHKRTLELIERGRKLNIWLAQAQVTKQVFIKWLSDKNWPWSLTEIKTSMRVSSYLDSLPETIRENIFQSPLSWSFEALVELTKVPLELLNKALALGRQTASQLDQWLASFKIPKHLILGKSVTEGHWKLIAKAFNLELDGYEIDQLREKARVIAPDGELTTDQLLALLNEEGHDGNSLLPPPKKKTYTPEDIAAIEQKAKAEALAEFQQHFQEQLEQVRREAAKKQQESDQQLEQQLQALMQQRLSPQQAGSTVGAQALAALLQPTGESHRAVTVPPSLSQRDFQSSSQKVKNSQKTPPGKGFGQSVNPKHRRHG